MENQERNLSRHQFRTLKYIREHRVTVQSLRTFSGTTLGSLAYAGLIAKSGTGDIAEIVLTPAGEAAFKFYTSVGYNERKHEGDLTERCELLLKHVRKFRVVEQIDKVS